ncbi:Os02g0711000 [Oryza sativa Japonica Group]|jgi:hypothetical protein|uniref:Os02g0711000 protein n=1 Tax=Oryza sativa subsp. japonica TaxID=39947 RepID=A0A0P0VNK7_ORYSJ|nr:hypothetical protein EE612_013235 [Oryza sativa]BAS80565.1 Os02g0711000 [Oryza sativa Japonica Group]
MESFRDDQRAGPQSEQHSDHVSDSAEDAISDEVLHLLMLLQHVKCDMLCCCTFFFRPQISLTPLQVGRTCTYVFNEIREIPNFFFFLLAPDHFIRCTTRSLFYFWSFF